MTEQEKQGPVHATECGTATDAATLAASELTKFVQSAKTPVVAFFAFDAAIPEAERHIVISGSMDPEDVLRAATVCYQRVQLGLDAPTHGAPN